jgi:hypothetical protein
MRLHNAFDKHSPAGPAWPFLCHSSPRSFRQCSCGLWYFDPARKIPLWGTIAADAIRAHPELKASLAAHFAYAVNKAKGVGGVSKSRWQEVLKRLADLSIPAKEPTEHNNG